MPDLRTAAIPGWIPDGATGHTPPVESSQQQQQQDPAQADADLKKSGEGEGNGKDKIDILSAFWDNTKDEKAPDNKSPQPPTVVVEQKPAEKSPTEAMQEHIVSLNLTDGIEFDKIAEGFRNNDMAPLNAAMQHVAGAAYRHALVSSNSLINTKVAKAVQEATAAAVSQTRGDVTVAQMEAELPYTKNPGIQPVARAALKQALGRNNNDVAKSIQEVNGYIMATSELARALPQNQPPPRKPGNQGFQNGGPVPDPALQQDEAIDWAGLFGPGG